MHDMRPVPSAAEIADFPELAETARDRRAAPAAAAEPGAQAEARCRAQFPEASGPQAEGVIISGGMYVPVTVPTGVVTAPLTGRARPGGETCGEPSPVSGAVCSSPAGHGSATLHSWAYGMNFRPGPAPLSAAEVAQLAQLQARQAGSA
jgi:hypothetical protein